MAASVDIWAERGPMVTLPSFIFFCGLMSLIQAARYAHRHQWQVSLRFYLVVMAIVAIMAATFAPRFVRKMPTNTRLGSTMPSKILVAVARVARVDQSGVEVGESEMRKPMWSDRRSGS